MANRMLSEPETPVWIGTFILKSVPTTVWAYTTTRTEWGCARTALRRRQLSRL